MSSPEQSTPPLHQTVASDDYWQTDSAPLVFMQPDTMDIEKIKELNKCIDNTNMANYIFDLYRATNSGDASVTIVPENVIPSTEGNRRQLLKIVEDSREIVPTKTLDSFRPFRTRDSKMKREAWLLASLLGHDDPKQFDKLANDAVRYVVGADTSAIAHIPVSDKKTAIIRRRTFFARTNPSGDSATGFNVSTEDTDWRITYICPLFSVNSIYKFMQNDVMTRKIVDLSIIEPHSIDWTHHLIDSNNNSTSAKARKPFSSIFVPKLGTA